MESTAATGDDRVHVHDVDDPIINMSDLLLEVVVPPEEETIFAALRHNDVTMVERLLRQNFDINYKQGGDPYKLKSPSMAHRIHSSNYAPLHIAVLHSTYQLVGLLLDNGADINILDEQQRTPIHFAVVAQRLPIIKLLIAKGAAIDAQSSSGRTPLLESVINGSFQCAEVFLSAGANLDLADTKGTSVLLQLAFAKFPNMPFIRRIIKAGGNVNITNPKGATPLMFAITINSQALVKLLLDNGADINQADKHGRSAIHFLAEHKLSQAGSRQNMLLFLINHGASIDTPDKAGETLLMKAIKNMSVSTLKTVLSADCSRDAKYIMEQSQTAYLCEMISGFKEWLSQELYTPRPLIRLCREQVRNSMKHELKQVTSLDLPRQLQHFILARDIHPNSFIPNR